MDNNRRLFIQKIAVLTGMSLIGVKALAESRKKAAPAAAAGADAPLCEPGKGMAGGMNYQHKHSEVKDAKLKVDRSGVPFDKQFCHSCTFFTAGGKIGADAVGKCSVISGCSVKADGWCSTWAKKA